MGTVTGSYREYYESKQWPEGATPAERLRFESVTRHIPAGVNSILEVGCGDGRLSYHLPNCAQMAYADISHSALRRFWVPGATRVQAAIGMLPFPDSSFELVVCSEVLEHLPAREFKLACAELARASARWALL